MAVDDIKNCSFDSEFSLSFPSEMSEKDAGDSSLMVESGSPKHISSSHSASTRDSAKTNASREFARFSKQSKASETKPSKNTSSKESLAVSGLKKRSTLELKHNNSLTNATANKNLNSSRNNVVVASPPKPSIPSHTEHPIVSYIQLRMRMNKRKQQEVMLKLEDLEKDYREWEEELAVAKTNRGQFFEIRVTNSHRSSSNSSSNAELGNHSVPSLVAEPPKEIDVLPPTTTEQQQPLQKRKRFEVLRLATTKRTCTSNLTTPESTAKTIPVPTKDAPFHPPAAASPAKNTSGSGASGTHVAVASSSASSSTTTNSSALAIDAASNSLSSATKGGEVTESMTTKNPALDTNCVGCSNHKNGQESETPRGRIPPIPTKATTTPSPPPSDNTSSSGDETNTEDDNSLCDNVTAEMNKQSKRMEDNETKKKANDKLPGRKPTTESSTSVTRVAVATATNGNSFSLAIGAAFNSLYDISPAGMKKQSKRVEGNETKKKTKDNRLGGDPSCSTTPLAFSSAEIAKEPEVVGKTQSSTKETFEDNQPKRQQEDSSDDSSNKTCTMTLENDNHENSVEEATGDDSSNESVSSSINSVFDDCSESDSGDCDSTSDFDSINSDFDDCSESDSHDCDSTSDFEVGE